MYVYVYAQNECQMGVGCNGFHFLPPPHPQNEEQKTTAGKITFSKMWESIAVRCSVMFHDIISRIDAHTLPRLGGHAVFMFSNNGCTQIQSFCRSMEIHVCACVSINYNAYLWIFKDIH